MKKLLFVLVFVFIGQQSMSQVYMMTFTENDNPPSGCQTSFILTKIDPTGNVTYTCLESWNIDEDPQTFVTINIEINAIINQGYKLIGTNFGGAGYSSIQPTQGAAIINGNTHNEYTTWYFAVP